MPRATLWSWGLEAGFWRSSSYPHLDSCQHHLPFPLWGLEVPAEKRCRKTGMREED